MCASGEIATVHQVLHYALILLAFGALTGVTTVLFGFGGGFVTVPVVYAASTLRADVIDPMHVAVASSAAVMVVNSLSATIAFRKSGRLRAEYIRPLIGPVAAGAGLGAVAAGHVDDGAVRILFVLYLVVTILDSLLRQGFLTPPEPREHLDRHGVRAVGIGIGAVASFLGVGGSVMTVPMMRRGGVPMADAAASANPLSLPVAVVATAVYAASSGHSTASDLSAGRLGAIDLLAVCALLAGSLPAIALSRRIVGAIPDRIHAAAYIALLAVVTAVMIAA
ncbi:sulfite exporter TauE/SafE family protein [Rhodococcus erythropolis]|nr:sulfite exporter TauE/SafE family protein [Rhodococcus erythropolis]OHF26225.1 permease [Rhodococcus erythropolis]